MLRALVLCSVIVVLLASPMWWRPLRAGADTESGDGKVTGGIKFLQQASNGPVIMTLGFRGLAPGEHGFHIHENAVRDNDCLTAGSHFNPNHNEHHGKSDILLRHLGDLGNVIADENGEINLELSDALVQLHGPSSIIGRSFVVHAKRDDLGVGDEESKKTGNAGARIACGTIKLEN